MKNCLSIDAQSFSNSFEGALEVVRLSWMGSSIFVFYCIFLMIQFFKVFWGGTWGAPILPPPPECIYDKNVLVPPDNRWEPFFHRETKRSRWQACFDRWWVQWTTCPHTLSKRIWCRTCRKMPAFDRVHSIGPASPTIKKKVNFEFWILNFAKNVKQCITPPYFFLSFL